MLPTILAIAGDDKVTEKCLSGYKVGNMTYKVHLDGHNLIPYVTGQTKESPRQSLMYFGDDGEVAAVRVGDYKFHLALQRANTMRQWAEPFVKVRLPYIMNLRRDPFERAEYNSNTYLDWMVNHVPQMYLMQAVVAGEVENFRKFPPRQSPASFNLDEVMRQVSTNTHA
jgi:arylsulfatase